MEHASVVSELFLAAGAVALMMLSGLAKRALEPRRSQRRCPSCGRFRGDCRCSR